MKTKIVNVTPATATKWLEKNIKNRAIRQSVVEAYARDMANGKWTLTHQGIAFNNKDELIDGQHRLTAVVLSGATVPMNVSFEVEDIQNGTEVMLSIDDLKPRSLGDNWSIHFGVENANLVAAICRMMVYLLANNKLRKITQSEATKVLNVYSKAIHAIVGFCPAGRGLRSAPVLAALSLAWVSDTKTVEEFCVRFFSGENLKQGDPELTLRNSIMSKPMFARAGGNREALAKITLNAVYHKAHGNKWTQAKSGNFGCDYFLGRQQSKQRSVLEILGLFESLS